MKLIELVNSVEALNKLSETKLVGGASFSVAKFLKDVTSDVETYHKVKNEKIVEYGSVVLDDEGKPKVDATGNQIYSFSVPGSKELTESGKKYVAEMQEIENKELDIKIPEIKASDLAESKIEPKYLIALTWLIKE